MISAIPSHEELLLDTPDVASPPTPINRRRLGSGRQNNDFGEAHLPLPNLSSPLIQLL